MNTSEALASPTAISRFHVAVALRVPLFPCSWDESRGRRARDRLRAARRPALDGTAPIRDTPLGAAIRPRRSPPTLSNRHHLNRRVWRTWGPALFLFADALVGANVPCEWHLSYITRNRPWHRRGRPQARRLVPRPHIRAALPQNPQPRTPLNMILSESVAEGSCRSSFFRRGSSRSRRRAARRSVRLYRPVVG